MEDFFSPSTAVKGDPSKLDKNCILQNLESLTTRIKAQDLTDQELAQLHLSLSSLMQSLSQNENILANAGADDQAIFSVGDQVFLASGDMKFAGLVQYCGTLRVLSNFYRCFLPNDHLEKTIE